MAALPEEVIEQFHLFLASPIHNTSQRLCELAELLDKELIRKPENYLGPEDFLKLMPVEGNYRRNYIDKLCAQLYVALNEFLTLKQFRESPGIRRQLLFASYEELKLDEWISSIYKEVTDPKKSGAREDIDEMESRLNIEWTKGLFLARQARSPMGDHLAGLDGRLEDFYMARKLNLATVIGNYNRLFKPEIEVLNLDRLLKDLEGTPEKYSILVHCQYAAWKLITSPSDAAFHDLLEKLRLEKSVSGLSYEFLQTAWYVALNHCLLQINQGNPDYLDITDKLYLELLENEFLLVEGKMLPDHFKNILTLRFRKGETSWVAEFVDRFREQLTNDYGGFIVEYADALVDYYHGNYTKTILCLEEVLARFKADIFLTIDARFWRLKAIYDRNEPDDSLFLESQQNSFRVFLIREKKLNEDQKKPFQHLNKLLGQLARLREMNGGDRKKKAPEFIGSLDGLKPLSNREWFRGEG